VPARPGSQARAHVVLCSSELNFRGAKQYWGVEDFMNVGPTAVNNAAHLAVLMGNIAHLLLKPFRKDHLKFGILDLKASFRGHKYVYETLKLLPKSQNRW
jgi:putative transposase